MGRRQAPRTNVLVPKGLPRGCIWPVSTTTPADRELFFGQSAANRIHVIEADWLERMQDCRLYSYRLPAEPFSLPGGRRDS
jgi:hypothetical protein